MKQEIFEEYLAAFIEKRFDQGLEKQKIDPEFFNPMIEMEFEQIEEIFLLDWMISKQKDYVRGLLAGEPRSKKIYQIIKEIWFGRAALANEMK